MSQQQIAPEQSNTVRVEVVTVAPPENPISRKSKLVTLLLCIFGGVLGFHKFYVGKVGIGILYLLTGGLLGMGWIVDIILICFGAFKDGDGKRIKGMTSKAINKAKMNKTSQ